MVSAHLVLQYPDWQSGKIRLLAIVRRQRLRHNLTMDTLAKSIIQQKGLLLYQRKQLHPLPSPYR